MADKRKRLQLLTLTPKSWSLRTAAEEFKVSKTTVQKARIIKEEKGILELPDLVVSKTIDQGTIQLAKAIYSDDQYTRQLPGEKIVSALERKGICQNVLSYEI